MLMILNPNILNNFYKNIWYAAVRLALTNSFLLLFFGIVINRSLKIKQNYLIVLTYERKKTEHFQNQTDKCFHR